ncbi:MAG: hypothetical protein ACFFAE_14390 [Candidatus Hodarchaeota archaeon]
MFSEKNGLMVFLTIWGFLIGLTFFLQSLIELSKWLYEIIPEIVPDLSTLPGINLLEWQGNFLIAFATLTIMATLFTGQYYILGRKEPDTGLTFFLVATGIASVIGLFFVLLNVAELLSAFLAMFGEDPATNLEWTPKLWGSIVLMVFASPLFLAYPLLQNNNLGEN